MIMRAGMNRSRSAIVGFIYNFLEDIYCWWKVLIMSIGNKFHRTSMVAKEKGYTEEIIENKGEHMTGSMLFNLVNNLSHANSILSGKNISLQDEIYFSQVKAIRELADRGACVIIGRCADHILKEYPNCLNIFIHADLDFRIKHLMEQDHISDEEAKKRINGIDKTRSYHYQYYTEKKWGNSKNYHLCLNSGMLGIEKCVSIIESVCLE